jgi:hypothetical protein
LRRRCDRDWLGFGFNYRTRPCDTGRRKHKRAEHEKRGGSDGDFRQQRLRAARTEGSARNRTCKERACIGFARLQEHSADKHNAAKKKQSVENVNQFRERPFNPQTTLLIKAMVINDLCKTIGVKT